MPVKEMTAEAPAKEAPKTFKVAEERAPVQEYHYLHRVVGATALPDGTLTGGMLDEEVMIWLNRGFKVHTVHFIGQHKGAGGEIFGYVYGYHLVKE